ncbi:CHAT domain-containing tetratricopeptide repeat protein [Aquimarina sp. 2201CG1-2-11]|uniref:CHAT domain-containing protein n=1 Tax=Aquimarina discodermiae TaxID=3231043 RepID=UPI0034627FCE
MPSFCIFAAMVYKSSFFLLLVLAQCVVAQTNIKSLDSILTLPIDFQSKRESINVLLRDKGQLHFSDMMLKTSVFFFKHEKYAEAIDYGQDFLEAVIEQRPIDSLKYRRALCNLGLFHYLDNQFDIAQTFYLQVINQSNVDLYRGRAFYKLGAIKNDVGDYYAALEYYKNAIKVYEEVDYHRGMISTSVSIAQTYKEISGSKSILKARKILNDLLGKQASLSFTSKNKQDVYHVLGVLYNQDVEDDQEKALYYYFKGLEIAKQRDDFYAISTINNNIGNVYLKQDVEKALQYYKQGLEKSEDSYNQGLFTHNIGNCYFKKGNYELARQFLSKSIILYANYKGQSDVLKVPVTIYESSINKNLILDSFIDLIKYQNHISRSEKELTITFNHIKVAEKLLAHIRFESNDRQSKLYWQEQASKLYQNGVKTAYLSGNVEKAFYFMEKNKALLLLKDVTDKALKKNANLPATIVLREERIKKSLHQLQDAFAAHTGEKKDSLVDVISTTKIEYQHFIDSLKVDYPEYYNYRKPSNVLALKQVQKGLQENEIYVEYILNEEEGYAILVKKEGANFSELKDVKQLNENIIGFKTKIASPLVTKEDFEAYRKLGYLLFKELFPFKDRAQLAHKKMTIVPDYTLQNFPFEALQSDTNLKETYQSYLITTAEIGYAYSLSFLEENRQISREHTIDFTGFAPINFEYDGLSVLKRSRLEVKEAKHQYSGKLFLDEEATKDSFINNARGSKIIHLSTHADAIDSITPWIAFKDKKLTLNELYTTNNTAELVVLSACNSSLGKVRSGEGVMSLARGFFYTGANSVISSLWNVDDKSGYYIMTSFYKHLKEGKTKSEALRLAKLDYIQNHSLSETSPYYWSSLVLIGDSGGIQSSSLSWLYWALIVVLLLLLVVIWFLKNRRNKNSETV